MYARKGNFTHGHDNRRDFPAPIFMKLADAQQNYVRIHYTDFLRWLIAIVFYSNVY